MERGLPTTDRRGYEWGRGGNRLGGRGGPTWEGTLPTTEWTLPTTDRGYREWGKGVSDYGTGVLRVGEGVNAPAGMRDSDGGWRR